MGILKMDRGIGIYGEVWEEGGGRCDTLSSFSPNGKTSKKYLKNQKKEKNAYVSSN